jgi:lipid-A-disaccharide synthase
MRLFISAGEASGDALGASLLSALKARRSDVEAFGMGGPRMEAAGFHAIESSEEVSVVGLAEVVKHLPRLLKLSRALAEHAIQAKPDAAILIDVPDFNIRVAKRLHKAGIPVVFYVGPSVWAWRAGRVRAYRPWIDRLLVLFPFEAEVWKQAGVDAVCVGHPLVDEIPRASSLDEIEPRLVALLPGSRAGEIARHFDLMLEAGAELVDRGLASRFVVPVAPSLRPELLLAHVERSRLRDRVELVTQDRGDPAPRRRALSRAQLALVASGTATLETALIGRPQVIVYRVSALSYWIARALAKIPWLGLVNIIVGREIVPELLQSALTTQRLASEASRLLEDPAATERELAGYRELRERLGADHAAERAAEAVLDLIASPRRR